MPKIRKPLRLKRSSHRFLPDPKRVITKLFRPSNGEDGAGGDSRVEAILERILAIPENEVPPMLEEILRDFSPRHRDIETVLERHCRAAARSLDGGDTWSRDRRLLIGAYFTHEYSVEGAAL